MQQFEVWHKKTPDFRDPNEPTVFKAHYDLIATIKCEKLDDTFRLTNHIDEPWWDNPEVRTVQESRSTSVGDLVRNVNTDVWSACCYVGWRDIVVK